jgi:hypothetical protein
VLDQPDPRFTVPPFFHFSLQATVDLDAKLAAQRLLERRQRLGRGDCWKA